MRLSRRLLPFVIIGVHVSVAAQTIHEVQLRPTNVFEPDAITIATGDTVRWVWAGGLHNVVNGEGPPGAEGDGELFDSGLPTGQIGATFEVTFSESGVYPYYSELSYFVGMRGVIRVTGSVSDPGREGDGEGTAEDDTCDALAAAVAALDDFRTATNLGDDLDDDGIPDEFQLALVQHAACSPDFGSTDIRDATRDAFTSNVASIRTAAETFANQKGGAEVDVSLAEFPELFGALSTISGTMQTAINRATIEPLPVDLQVVAIERFDIEREAFSGAGDLDGDGVSNRTEFLLAISEFGQPSPADFIALAGSPVSVGDGGGVPILGCGAQRENGSRAPWGDAALIALTIGALIANRVRDDMTGHGQ